MDVLGPKSVPVAYLFVAFAIGRPTFLGGVSWVTPTAIEISAGQAMPSFLCISSSETPFVSG